MLTLLLILNTNTSRVVSYSLYTLQIQGLGIDTVATAPQLLLVQCIPQVVTAIGSPSAITVVTVVLYCTSQTVATILLYLLL